MDGRLGGWMDGCKNYFKDCYSNQQFFYLNVKDNFSSLLIFWHCHSTFGCIVILKNRTNVFKALKKFNHYPWKVVDILVTDCTITFNTIIVFKIGKLKIDR